MTYLEAFEQNLDLAIRVHDAARLALPPTSPEGHFVNENTLVRIYDELEAIRSRMRDSRGKVPDWKKKPKEPGFGAYITMRVYRDSITHNRGRLNRDFYERDLKKFYDHYAGFCKTVGVPPLNPNDKLMLSFREPDFLLTLIEGVRKFAENVLPGSGGS